MPDKHLIYIECGKEFLFKEREQIFYKKIGFKSDPVKCPKCRKIKKSTKFKKK
jgi:hypothetical protein